VKPILASRQKNYEEAFHEALKRAVRPGDTVWDVGANVGVYTKIFLEWSGADGTVIAFEPLPKAIIALEKTVEGCEHIRNLTVVAAALADKPGSATFAGDLEGDGVTTTGHIAEGSDSQGQNSITVEVTTADLAVSQKGVAAPSVVKIDVEGFEEDVLNGGESTFGSGSCREILVEMHFSRMDERKLGNSASRIVSKLKNWGYQVDWVDPSHLHAKRIK
jgi:FkbM family methyltransferase